MRLSIWHREMVKLRTRHRGTDHHHPDRLRWISQLFGRIEDDDRMWRGDSPEQRRTIGNPVDFTLSKHVGRSLSADSICTFGVFGVRQTLARSIAGCSVSRTRRQSRCTRSATGSPPRACVAIVAASSSGGTPCAPLETQRHSHPRKKWSRSNACRELDACCSRVASAWHAARVRPAGRGIEIQ